MKDEQRTLQQNKALHVFLRQLAECLNDAGFDMRATLREDWEIPWTPENAKEHLWRPLQEAMTGKHSTTEANTVDYNAIQQVIARHLGEKLGVTIPPWPSQYTQSLEAGKQLYGREDEQGS